MRLLALARLCLSGSLLLLFCLQPVSKAQPNRNEQQSAGQPYAIEYFYKAKWGHAEEFLALFKKNHLPLLRKEMELGRILKLSMAAPRYHGTEDGRWDYRVTIVFKNAAIANDDFDSPALLKQLFPDQETHKKEEQRRFEILEAHWDVPVKEVDLSLNKNAPDSRAAIA